MNDAVIVEARFETDGSIRPLAFMWNQKWIRITSLGRQWEQNGEHHFLVMSPDEKVYELVYLPDPGVWRLIQRAQDHGISTARV